VICSSVLQEDLAAATTIKKLKEKKEKKY